MNERITDFFIGGLLKEAGIKFTPNGSNIKEIQNALKQASKSGTGKNGFPEFTAVVDSFVLVIENKADISKQARYENDDGLTLAIEKDAVKNYAENGALHYALHIVKNTSYKQVFAFGCSGDKKHHILRPIFVGDKKDYKILKEVDNFQNFTTENIERYYHEQVLEEESQEFTELKDILSRAEQLHKDMRNYASLGVAEKPLVVSAILLALNEPEDRQKLIDTLNGDTVKTDGQKVFDAVSSHMKRVKVEPQVKLDKVLDQFNIVKNHTALNQKNSALGKTPLRYFTEYVSKYVIEYAKNNSPEDVLGQFYGEFMSYSGGDGQNLGVILTPPHITELFCDLAEIKPTDILFDPCCGTGGFLIAGLHHMLNKATTAKQRDKIKKNQIYGFELRPDMFSMATTNMILRGDGKSNLLCDNFLEQNSVDLRKKKFTVGFMNPPYSQAKNKDTAHLSEINFVQHLLDSMADGARVVVIIPQSTMVGKRNEDKAIKREILKQHTLKGVITLNKNTFYRVGTNPCIAVFICHQPHPAEYEAKFIDFGDDGFVVNKHIGLMKTERAKEKRARLLACWNHNTDAETRFMVKTKVDADDEWLHSFYYFNDEIPGDADFEKTMADYLTFEFNMIIHGRGYLFGLENA
ncbi:MAG: SAM-dependent methyltransferase [Candidatus Margulisbacteria bacterium]|jgi:type I restriction-modification system DNA methylase subunit|nr:SAM-dependent methyltransferase [Candidatus Margulisiibacteriota bacterium]